MSTTDDPRAKLIQQVSDLLGGNLGMAVTPAPRTPPGRHIFVSLRFGLMYAILFCVIPLLAPPVVRAISSCRPENMPPRLFWLEVYATLFVIWSTLTARLAGERALTILRGRLAPALSDKACEKTSRDLARGYDPRRLTRFAWIIAILASLAAFWALSQPVDQTVVQTATQPVAKPTRPWQIPFFWQIAWFCLGWLFLFAAGAKTTMTARFYGEIAEHLDLEGSGAFLPDPARSAVVRAASALGQTIMLFWIGATFCFALLPVFDSITADPWTVLAHPGDLIEGYGAPSWFAALVAPISMTFSLALATYIYLRSESSIRRQVAVMVHNALRRNEVEVAALLAKPRSTKADREKLDRLIAEHRDLTTAAAYGSVLKSALGLIVPLIGPVVAILSAVLKSRS